MSGKATACGCDKHHIHNPLKPDLLSEAISDQIPAPDHTLLVLADRLVVGNMMGEARRALGS